MHTSAVAPQVQPDLIFQLATGFMASKMLFTAADIDLFAGLADEPLMAGQRVGLPLRSVRIVADAMVALGLLTLDNGRYRNSDVAQTYLSGRTPADMRPMLKLWDRLSYPRGRSWRTQSATTAGKTARSSICQVKSRRSFLRGSKRRRRAARWCWLRRTISRDTRACST